MSEESIASETPSSFSFLQGGADIFSRIPGDGSEEDKLNTAKHKITDLFNVKNLHFLFGAGVSADTIPAMTDMVLKVEESLDKENKTQFSLFKSLTEKTNSNLEDMLGILYSGNVFLSGVDGAYSNIESIESDVKALINLIETVLFEEINIDLSAADASLDLYKKFYQKLSYRSKELARVNVFTTNNDLLSEYALDFLNINFNNGFGGGLERTFNPARFSYTYSRKLDTSHEKYEPLENMVYLYKLHGSISWRESDVNSFFNITEVPVKHGDSKPEEPVLIYPTPLKQNKSLGAPYADLIREFQKKLLSPHSVLVVIGYSFSDEHINNIIYQALASNSSMSVLVFGNFADKPLAKSKDSRVYQLHGEIGGNKLHYFEYIVENFIPDMDEGKKDTLLENFAEEFKRLKQSSLGEV